MLVRMVRRACLASLVGCAAVAAGCGGGDAPQTCVVVAPTQSAGDLFVPADPPVPLVQVSGASPFAPGCGLERVCGTVYVGAEVEPYVAVNPQDPQNLVGVWQQDRWSNGGAQGALAAFSSDGGQTWSTRQAPFTRCTGGNSVNGGDYARATDPWVSFGPDGTAYWMAMVITDLPDGRGVSGMRVSRSTDGGDTWSAPVTLIEDASPYFNDKNTLTADPTDAAYVYAVWDRLDFARNAGPAYFARSTDSGVTWQAARAIHDPGIEAQTIGNQVVVLSDGTLLNLFTEIQYGTATTPDSAQLRVIHSTDRGASWGSPVTVSPIHPLGAYDPETFAPIRDGSILGTIAVAPDDTVWVAWQDSTLEQPCGDPPCRGPEDRIALAHSTDGGATWSEPVRVNAEPDTQAFTPAVHVAADGTIGVTYYDLRDNTSDASTLLASHWLATSADGVNWTEALVSGPFDLSIAPDARGLFLGDYQGLRSGGGSFVPFFAQTGASLASRTDIFALPLPAAAAAFAKSAAMAVPAYRAASAPTVVPSGEWALRVGENIRRQRAQQFPERIRPDIPAQLLR
jgi:hypothetical protein